LTGDSRNWLGWSRLRANGSTSWSGVVARPGKNSAPGALPCDPTAEPHSLRWAGHNSEPVRPSLAPYLFFGIASQDMGWGAVSVRSRSSIRELRSLHSAVDPPPFPPSLILVTAARGPVALPTVGPCVGRDGYRRTGAGVTLAWP